MSVPYRIVHISDLHIWRISYNPLLWLGKRGLGFGNLVLRRGRKFIRHELARLVQTIREDLPNHVIVSGDVSTTSLPLEFEIVATAFGDWLRDPSHATIIPGNHDRYTRRTHRLRAFEKHFNAVCEQGRFPFLKPLVDGLDLIGFDPCIPNPLFARGFVSPDQAMRLKELLPALESRGTRVLLFVCHYPAEAPQAYEKEVRRHNLIGGELLLEALSTCKLPIFWLHGHIHRPWRFQSPTLSNLVYLNPGAPLLKRSLGISLGRWILEWNGETLKTEWRSLPEAAGYLSG